MDECPNLAVNQRAMELNKGPIFLVRLSVTGGLPGLMSAPACNRPPTIRVLVVERDFFGTQMSRL